MLRREYELTVIANAQLSAEDSKKLLAKYEAIFLGDNGELITSADWGQKKLAYPINKHFRGKYAFYDFLGTPENLAEAKRLMQLDDNILRYLVIKLGGEVDVDKRKAELAKAEAAAAAKRQAELN